MDDEIIFVPLRREGVEIASNYGWSQGFIRSLCGQHFNSEFALDACHFLQTYWQPKKEDHYD